MKILIRVYTFIETYWFLVFSAGYLGISIWQFRVTTLMFEESSNKGWAVQIFFAFVATALSFIVATHEDSLVDRMNKRYLWLSGNKVKIGGLTIGMISRVYKSDYGRHMVTMRAVGKHGFDCDWDFETETAIVDSKVYFSQKYSKVLDGLEAKGVSINRIDLIEESLQREMEEG